MRTIKISVPGKLIISGEHAVVHGCPAISAPCDIFLKASLSPFTPQKIKVSLTDFKNSKILTFGEARSLYIQNLSNFKKFQNGRLEVHKILAEPADIIFHTFHHLNEKYRFPYGGEIVISSDIPVNSGMGSSAATIIAVIKLIREEFSLIMSDVEIFRLARKIENLQHGRSSGIDPATIINNRTTYYHDGRITTLNVKEIPLKQYLIDTGRPASTTGECVNAVKELFCNQLFGSTLRRQFSSVTEKLRDALERGRIDQVIALVRTNNLLLKKIGVVPQKLIDFSRKIEENIGGAFKICGAGTIKGDGAGIGIIFSERSPEKICEEFGYKILASK